MNKLKENTSSSESRKNLKHLESYLKNLEKRMVELTEITEYDQKMASMDNNIRILTRLIVEEMQNFIYNESMYLVHMESLIYTKSLYAGGRRCGSVCGYSRYYAAPFFSVFKKHYKTCDRNPWKCQREVGRGNFEISEVDTDSMEIEELDAGIRRMAEKIEQLLQSVKKEEEMQHLTQLQLLQAQVVPHFL